MQFRDDKTRILWVSYIVTLPAWQDIIWKLAISYFHMLFEKSVFESTKSRFSQFAEIRRSQTNVTHVGANKVKYHLEVDTPPHFIFL